MAEEQAPQEQARPQETDVLFKLQLQFTDFVANNWRYGLGIVGAVALGVLAYNGWHAWRTSSLQADYGAIGDVDFRMPKLDRYAELGLGKGDDPADTERMANLEEGAKRFEAAAAEASGAARIYGYIKAAEAWKRRGDKEKTLAALRLATEVDNKELPGFTAHAALAGALLNSGQTDAGLEQHKKMTELFIDDFFGPEAWLQYARALLAAGQADAARAAVSSLESKYPNVTRTELAELKAKLGGNG